MKAAVIVVCAVIALLAFTGRLSFGTWSAPEVPDSAGAVDGVNGVFERALAAGEPPAPGSAAAKLNRQCELRERRLSRLRRPASLTGARDHALRVLAILQAHSRRASTPAEVRALELDQQRLIQRLALAAGRGDYRAAQAEGTALRELAGRANASYLRLGLTNCLIRPSAIPF